MPLILLPFFQCVGVLSLLVDRVGNDPILEVCDVGPLLLPFTRFLNFPLSSALDLRTRTQFCGIVRVVVKFFTFPQGLGIRPTLLDTIMSWTTNKPDTVYRIVSVVTIALICLVDYDFRRPVYE